MYIYIYIYIYVWLSLYIGWFGMLLGGFRYKRNSVPFWRYTCLSIYTIRRSNFMCKKMQFPSPIRFRLHYGRLARTDSASWANPVRECETPLGDRTFLDYPVRGRSRRITPSSLGHRGGALPSAPTASTSATMAATSRA